MRVIPIYEPTPMGLIAQVHIDVWKALTADHGCDTFVELGVYRGGTGIYFVEKCKKEPGFEYLGVDLHPEWCDPRFKQAIDGMKNARVIWGDVFNQVVKNQVAETIARRGKTFVFADSGGENLKESFKDYALMLKPGDYMAIHDFPDEIGNDELEWMLAHGFYFKDIDKWLYELNTPLFCKE